MLTHVVLIALKPGATPEDGDRIVHDALNNLTRIPGVRHLSAGQLLQEDAGFDYGLAMQFEDAAALDAYRVHPLHQAFVEVLSACVDHFTGYDFVS